MENTLHIIGAAFTALFGLYAIVKPLKVAKLVGVTPNGKRGISEIRATYGGWVLGLAAFTLWSNTPVVFYCLGIGWIGAALLRISSFFVDGSYSKANLRITIYEIIVAVMLLINF